MASDRDQTLTTAQAAQHSGQTQDTIRKWIRQGKLRAQLRPSGRYAISQADLDATLASIQNEAQVPATQIISVRDQRVIGKSIVVMLGHPLWATVIGGLILILLVGAFNWFRPDPPARRGADLSTVEVTDTSITLSAFIIDYFDFPLSSVTATGEEIRAALREKGLPADVSDQSLRTLGVVVRYDVTFEGLVGQECLIEWSVYFAETDQPLPDSYLRDQPAFPHGTIIPRAAEDSVSNSIWIPRPPREGPFIVQLEIHDDAPVSRRVRLAQAESDPFN